MNYFSPYTAAERYAKGRPDFHGTTIERIKAFLQLNDRLDKGLDIACGTGLSTKALLAIARQVYGTDSSEQMLRFASLQDQINYKIAKAEEQPFPDASFDLITVCSGVHWFAIDRFLAEAHRLLKDRSWLVLYDNFFIAEMEGNEKFKSWYEQIYLKQFPAPARNDQYDWSKQNLERQDFDFAREEQFSNAVSFTKKELILYFTTQSNIISSVESGAMTYEAAESWVDKELTPFFNNEDTIRVIYFGNWIKYLQRLP